VPWQSSTPYGSITETKELLCPVKSRAFYLAPSLIKGIAIYAVDDIITAVVHAHRSFIVIISSLCFYHVCAMANI
jgi:hypothetical protein